MKKLISLLLALVMVASMSTVAFAAEFEFELVLMDEAQENEVTEINVGDKVYLMLSSSTKTSKYGVEVNIDMSAFEVAVITEEGESWEDADFGSHTGSYVINPDGQEGVMAIGGVKTGATKAIEATIGLIATKAGTYEISFKGQQDKNMPSESTSTCATDPITLVVKGDEPEPTVPTAKDLGLFTDATQNAKVTEKVMTSNGWSIEKALLFVSGINNDAAVVSYGTEITCEGYDKVLDIPCVNSYEASETVKGFVAAVSSIRNTNLTKTFTAKAYADVTVGEDTVRIYATDAATAVYGN